MSRYSVSRKGYHVDPTPKQAALMAIVGDRFKKKDFEPPQIPSSFAFPAYVADIKDSSFGRDGALIIRLVIPPEFVEDFYPYIPFIAGEAMAVAMEPIKVTYDDLKNITDIDTRTGTKADVRSRAKMGDDYA